MAKSKSTPGSKANRNNLSQNQTHNSNPRSRTQTWMEPRPSKLQPQK